MKWIILITSLFVLAAVAVFVSIIPQPAPPVEVNTTTPTVPLATPTPTIAITPPPGQMLIPQKLHVFQTFNNCGPASLSMLLSYYNINRTQQELGLKLRPYQNPQGDNDDKSVTIEELAVEAANYNLVVYHRRHGSVDLLKKLIANNIPVLVRTWLHPNEDIGHYRIVRGYDDTTQELLQDDSYENQNLKYTYSIFEEMWQPFNYEYLIAVTPEEDAVARAILQDDVDEQTAWQNTLAHAITEAEESPSNPYPIFNQSVAHYHLGNFPESVRLYESVEAQLPSRMLWYQIEPIQAFFRIEMYDKGFALTDRILNNNNRGFTELYIIRGDAYKAQGNLEAARSEFEKAVFYNINSQAAQNALNTL